MDGNAHEKRSSPITLDYFLPAEDLRDHISSYYLFRADLPRVADLMRADLAQMRFMLSGSGHYSFTGGISLPTPEISLLGPTTAASSFVAKGPLLTFGIGLLPAGWAAMVCEDASLHANRVGDATALFGPALNDTLDALRHAPTPAAMVTIADEAMRALVRAGQEPPLWFTHIADEWLAGEPSPRVDELVARTGLSARQIERLARRVYGAPPKMLARKYRALRAASLLGRQADAWSGALGEAFYDQSHFIREFKHFTGQTPRQLQKDPSPVTTLTLKGRHMLTGRGPKLTVIS